MSRVLIISDLHLHNWRYGATYKGNWNSRLLEQEKFLEHIAYVVKAYNIPIVVFCGDAFHTHGRLTADVISVAYRGFRKIANAHSHGILCYALVGNHEFMTSDGRINSLEFLKGTGWEICFPRLRDSFNGKKFGFISYTSNQEFFNDQLAQFKDCDYLFLHQGVDKVSVGNGFELPNEFIKPDKIPSHILAFTGHYHKHQKVTDNLVIVGSPMQHDWNDSGDERGYIILDTDTNKWDFYPYQPAPKFAKIDIRSDYGKEHYQNNYVKLFGEDVKFGDFESIKEVMLKNGARSVEIVPNTIEVTPELKGSKSFSLEKTIEVFEKDNKLSEVDVEVGQKLRSGLYETT